VLHLLDARRLETVQRLFHGYPEEAQKKWLEYGSFEFWAMLDPGKKKHVMRFADEYEHDLVAIVKKVMSLKGDNGKDVIRESRMGTIKRKSEPYKNIYEINSRSETFANWYYERKLLGYSHCVRLKTIFDDKREGLAYVEDVSALRVGQRPDQSHAIHPARQPWKVFANLYTCKRRRNRLKFTAYLARCVRLHIQRIQLTPGAVQEKTNA